jgi:hypothetical protein
MQFKREIESLKKVPTKSGSEMENEFLIQKIREVVADYNQIAAYFQKKELGKLGGKEIEIELEFKSPGSK